MSVPDTGHVVYVNFISFPRVGFRQGVLYDVNCIGFPCWYQPGSVLYVNSICMYRITYYAQVNNIVCDALR